MHSLAYNPSLLLFPIPIDLLYTSCSTSCFTYSAHPVLQADKELKTIKGEQLFTCS